MCGIAGLIDFAAKEPKPVALARLDLALAEIARRGPDGVGIWADGGCLLGHRRLAIVDLSPAGHQPMIRDRYTISFNGMIFNYRELREELAARGCHFSSTTDTEVLIEGWRIWGAGLLPRLNGFFAFALWDADKREMILARDRFGEKPLFWKRRAGGVAFASSLFACAILDGARGTVDPEALAAFLALKYVPEPLCILAGFEKLPPGHMVRITPQGASASRWYDLSPDPQVATLRPADRAAYLHDLIASAVKLRLVADVGIGAFLSGGIDSSLVAAVAGPGLKTFTIGFATAGGYFDERGDARLTARHLGTEHHELTIDPDTAPASFSAVFDGLDEPFADNSAIPTYLVSQAIRSHVTVALSGDGGDELFGGYRRHQGELWAGLYRRLPALLRKGLVEPLLAAAPQGKDSGWLNALRVARRFVSAGAADPVGRHAGWMRVMPPEWLIALVGRDFDLAARLASARAGAPYADSVSQTLFGDIATLLPGQMLPKVDRMSMANAIEVRPPLLDHRVVEAAVALPPEVKVARGRGKAILRDAFASDLPAEVFTRPKRGFEFPVADWLRAGPWRSFVEDAVRPEVLAEMGLGDRLPAIWLAGLDAGRAECADMLWSLVALHQWHLRHAALPV